MYLADYLLFQLVHPALWNCTGTIQSSAQHPGNSAGGVGIFAAIHCFHNKSLERIGDEEMMQHGLHGIQDIAGSATGVGIKRSRGILLHRRL